MVKFLLERPIAVLMAFTACVILGLVTYFALPISLLPDIAIPEITVQVSAVNISARELENAVMKPIRQQLIQVSSLKNMTSETRDGSGLIRLSFDYGTNTDLAFIEVNEKIDGAMNYLPKDTDRPKVIKASATDIPVFYLNLTLKNDKPYESTNQQAFIELSEFSQSVIKKRIEQLPEVAMVDVTGAVSSCLQLSPDEEKMSTHGLTVKDIEGALRDNNVEPGSMKVRDGYYEYNIKFSTLLRTPSDVENLFIKKDNRLFQLKDFCEVSIVPMKEKGISISNGKRSVTFAIIKQADENMEDMKDALKETMTFFAKKYPSIDFSISRNQTELLDYTISNLQQNLSLGFILICIVAILFLGDIKSPFIIALSMVVSIIISFLFFYIFHMSLNIISLSGLILALGMMIDSSIIVTENISQYREQGYSLRRACVAGTSEVITPMLSSSLTTIAVFVPLVFMSGIAGAIFYDQAFSVAVGLMVSYFTGIILLPVLYMLVYRTGVYTRKWKKWNKFDWQKYNPITSHSLERFYNKGIDWVFNHKTYSLLFCIVALPLCFFYFIFIDKERMPEIDQNELLARVEWNENIHLEENSFRVNQLLGSFKSRVVIAEAAVGQQDYFLKQDEKLTGTEAEIYFKTANTDEIMLLQKDFEKELYERFPLATVHFSPPETVFEKIFVTGEPDIIAEFYPRNEKAMSDNKEVDKLEHQVAEVAGVSPLRVSFLNQLNLVVDKEKLLLYQVSYDDLYRTLKTAFRENGVGVLHAFQNYLPIYISGDEQSLDKILSETFVSNHSNVNEENQKLPLREFVRIEYSQDLKTLTAGKNGEYIPLKFYEVGHPQELINKVKLFVKDDTSWNVNFSGSFFSSRKMLDQLVVILFVSLLLMYFILAAQFESFVQPLLVLVEIPIDVAFALVLLWACGHTLNLMSAIGLIVTCGIVINDSILKLDAINELRKMGVPLFDAIHEAGRRRLRPIIMTSLTTLFAMVPLLFSSDMGSELQQPLAIAMIGTMVVGTLVSLFLIPLLYWFIYHRSTHNKK